MQNKTDLLTLGWDSYFESQLQPSEIVARVIGEERGLYRILLSPQQEGVAIITGKLRHSASGRGSYPAVGDWLVCEKPAASMQWMIQRVLSRKSCLSRKVAGETTEEQIIAANVDYVMIATSCNQNFNTARIERYLTLARNSGAKPLVVLTKSDLLETQKAYIEQLKAVSNDLEYIFVSSHQSEGLNELKNYFLPHRTNVLVGSSGVGKSTLINALLGEEKLKTQEIRDADGKGKHTTTARYLLLLPFGGMIIDTPGMREVQVLDVEEGLQEQYADIEALQIRCKFSDCRHATEPGCAIKNALANEELSMAHWQSYLKLKSEVKHIQEKANKKIMQRKKSWESKKRK